VSLDEIDQAESTARHYREFDRYDLFRQATDRIKVLRSEPVRRLARSAVQAGHGATHGTDSGNPLAPGGARL